MSLPVSKPTTDRHPTAVTHHTDWSHLTREALTASVIEAASPPYAQPMEPMKTVCARLADPPRCESIWIALHSQGHPVMMAYRRAMLAQMEAESDSDSDSDDEEPVDENTDLSDFVELVNANLAKRQ